MIEVVCRVPIREVDGSHISTLLVEGDENDRVVLVTPDGARIRVYQTDLRKALDAVAHGRNIL